MIGCSDIDIFSLPSTAECFQHLQTVSLPSSIWEAAFIDTTYRAQNITVEHYNVKPNMSTEFLVFSRDGIQLYVLTCETTMVDTTFILETT
jgi:hypothetical protein